MKTYQKQVERIVDLGWSHLSKIYKNKFKNGEDVYALAKRICPYELIKMNRLEAEIDSFDLSFEDYKLRYKCYINGWINIFNIIKDSRGRHGRSA